MALTWTPVCANLLYSPWLPRDANLLYSPCRESRGLHSDGPSTGMRVLTSEFVHTVVLDILLEVSAEEGVIPPRPYDKCIGGCIHRTLRNTGLCLCA